MQNTLPIFAAHPVPAWCALKCARYVTCFDAVCFMYFCFSKHTNAVRCCESVVVLCASLCPQLLTLYAQHSHCICNYSMCLEPSVVARRTMRARLTCSTAEHRTEWRFVGSSEQHARTRTCSVYVCDRAGWLKRSWQWTGRGGGQCGTGVGMWHSVTH